MLNIAAYATGIYVLLMLNNFNPQQSEKEIAMEPRKQPNNYELDDLCTKGFRSVNKALIILNRLNKAEERKRLFRDQLVAFRGLAA